MWRLVCQTATFWGRSATEWVSAGTWLEGAWMHDNGCVRRRLPRGLVVWVVVGRSFVGGSVARMCGAGQEGCGGSLRGRWGRDKVGMGLRGRVAGVWRRGDAGVALRWQVWGGDGEVLPLRATSSYGYRQCSRIATHPIVMPDRQASRSRFRPNCRRMDPTSPRRMSARLSDSPGHIRSAGSR